MRAGAIELSPANGQAGARRGLVWQWDDGRVSVLIAGEETGGRFALLETVEARGEEPPRHLHHWEDEALYVLDGELAVCLGEEWHRVPAGAAILLPRGMEHGFAVVGAAARLLSVLAPAGFERFYAELAVPDPADRSHVERVITVAARYGVEITGPPPSRPPYSEDRARA